MKTRWILSVSMWNDYIHALCSQTNPSGRKQNCLLTLWIVNKGLIKHIRDSHLGSSRSWLSAKYSSVSSFSWGIHRSWIPAPKGILVQLKPGTNSSPQSALSGINSSLSGTVWVVCGGSDLDWGRLDEKVCVGWTAWLHFLLSKTALVLLPGL